MELQELIPLAEGGNVVAQSNLGCRYILNNKDDASYKTGVAWLQKSADGGFPPAQYHLGICYLRGWGVKADYYKAYDLFDEATKWPDPIPTEWNISEEDVQVAKGHSYLNKAVTAMLLSYSTGIADMLKAAEYGEKHAIAYLPSITSIDGKSLNADYLAKAYEEAPILAARIEGAFLYYNGHEEEGLEKLLVAAKGGDTPAADTVINHYKQKIRTKEDILLLEDLIPFASLKTAEGLVSILANLYMSGIIVEQDTDKGIDLYYSIVNRGSVMGALVLVQLATPTDMMKTPEHHEFMHTTWESIIEPKLDSPEFAAVNTGVGLSFFAEAFHYGKYGFEKNEQTALKLYALTLKGVEQLHTRMQEEQVISAMSNFTSRKQRFFMELYNWHQKRSINRNIKQIEKQLHENAK